jgi:outer membrane protein TolC
MKKIIALHRFVFCAMLVLIGGASAQTLDSLVAATMHNNLKLQSLAYKHKEHDARMEQRGVFPAPRIGLQLNQVPFSSGNPLRDAFSQNLSISQMIPLGGKLDAMVAAEHSGLSGIHAEIDEAESQLTAQVKMAYIKWIAAVKKQDILTENAGLLVALADFLKTGFNTSSQTQGDLLLLQSEALVNQTQVALAKQEITAQQILLQRYTGLPAVENPDTMLLTKPVGLLSDSLIDRLLTEENPRLRQMDAMIAMNKAEAEANEKERIPDLMVEAMLMRMPQGMQLTTKTNPEMITGMGMTEYMYTVGASVTLPFLPWTRKGIDAKSEELMSATRRLELEQKDMLSEMSAQIKNALHKSRSLNQNATVYREQVIPLLEASERASLLAYQSGSAGISKVLETRKMLLMEKMNYVMILADERMSAIEAEMMLGINLDERN